MFKYTRAAFTSLVKDLKLWSKILSWIFFSVFVGYYTYSIVMNIINANAVWENMDHLNFFVNLIALILVILGTVLNYVLIDKKYKKELRISKRIISWLKIILKTITLGFTIYGFYTSVKNEINPMQIVLTTLLIIFWILSALIEIITSIISSKITVFEEAVKKDFQDMKQPFENVGNTVKRFFGVEVEEKEEKESHIIKKLDKIIEWKKQRKEEKKKEKKNKNT